MRANYLVAQKPLRTNVTWNGQILPQALRRAVVDIVSWKKLNHGSEALFRGFAPSGKRSYVGVLKNPLEIRGKAYSAVKLKAVGNTDPDDPHPPSLQEYDIDSHRIIVKKDGSISVEATYRQPHFGRTYDRATTENTFMQIANERGLPAPFSLGEGEYPDLEFDGRTLGYNFIALKDFEADVTRLGKIFQVWPSSPREYLLKLASIFFLHNATLKDLEYLFHAAGTVQRQYNNAGLIPDDCHVGNFALTEEAQVVLNDFGSGKNKDDLSAAQATTYQLLDINRFIYSTFVLRAGPVGELLISKTHPVSAYLDGYFGQNVLRDSGTPEKMIRGLKKPREKPDGNNFEGSMEIMKYCWTCLYEPLQEVLAAEGKAYPLSSQEIIEKYVGIFKSFFGNDKPSLPE